MAEARGSKWKKVLSVSVFNRT